MRLIFRFLRVLVLWVSRFLISLIIAVFLHYIMPFLLTTLRFLRRWVLFSFTATVNGPRKYINRLAGEWTERIHEGSENRDHIHQVYQLCRFLVVAIVVLGWLVAGVFTYLLFRVAYGFFI